MTRVLKRHFGYYDAVVAPANIVTTCFLSEEKRDDSSVTPPTASITDIINTTNTNKSTSATTITTTNTDNNDDIPKSIENTERNGDKGNQSEGSPPTNKKRKTQASII
jgi:hypothetical protein